ncbi:MAG: iron chelate uptake ABC transporter family permease subunit [Candidatus Thermoplasmatota archaeon]|nr:iron chelate uptake ABC transporter family permease subunit [Candidatus Thermoplasmatota archaeon]
MRRRLLWLAALTIMLLASAMLAILVGTLGPIGPGISVAPGVREHISFGEALGAVFGETGDWPAYYSDIFWEVRIPRVLLAAAVGAALACAGTAMQAIFRNPMADPYIVGVSSGASVGAVLASLFGFATTALVGAIITPALAFTTALLTVFVVYSLGVVGGKVYVNTLLLSGIAVAAFLGAVVSLMIYFAGQQYHRIIFWMLGSLSIASWSAVAVVAIAATVGAVLVFISSRDMNALLLGEETAHNLGVDPEGLKTLMLVVAAIMTAAAVAFTGVIGFVGLIIPHMVRLVVGADHRMLVPAATLSGAIFLIWADTLARTVISPTELPVGIITAICGGPFFLYLLRRNRLAGETR